MRNYHFVSILAVQAQDYKDMTRKQNSKFLFKTAASVTLC